MCKSMQTHGEAFVPMPVDVYMNIVLVYKVQVLRANGAEGAMSWV